MARLTRRWLDRRSGFLVLFIAGALVSTATIASGHGLAAPSIASGQNKLVVTTVTPASGSTASGSVTWQVNVSGGTPKRVDFAIDGTVTWTERVSPYLYGGVTNGLDTTLSADGSHTLTAVAYPIQGSPSRASVTVTVANGSVPPTSAGSGDVPASAGGYDFGTINTLSPTASQEVAAGVNTAEVDVGWDLYEPRDGVFDSGYGSSVAQRVRTLQTAGYRVVLGLALHYPPSWVFGYPDSQLVNQYGGKAGEVNLIFNQSLRQKAAALISRLNQDVGLNRFYAIRITSGGDAEAMYPQEGADGVHHDGYWAYDRNAQTGANSPPTIAPNPFPGWKPGQPTYNSQPFTASGAQRWYSWYLGALLDSVNWQIQTYKSLGYTGYFQVLTPGVGSRPDEYQTAINNYLNGLGDANATMGRGAAWDKWYGALPDKSRVVAYVSSLADSSGSPANNPCQATDSSVSITDPQIDSWSAARWITYNAHRYGIPTSGENPGGGATYGVTMMQAAAKQMQTCGMQGMYWAHDANLYDGTSGVTLQDFATVIAQYR